jgi:hypothetical protein
MKSYYLNLRVDENRTFTIDWGGKQKSKQKDTSWSYLGLIKGMLFHNFIRFFIKPSKNK